MESPRTSRCLPEPQCLRVNFDEGGNIMKMKFYVYRWYEYKTAPLLFLTLPDGELSLEQKAMILKTLDVLYGDTDQDTTEWAMEYELWARMLLLNDALLINPKYLYMENGFIPPELHEILSESLSERVLSDYVRAVTEGDALSKYDDGNDSFEIQIKD